VPIVIDRGAPREPATDFIDESDQFVLPKCGSAAAQPPQAVPLAISRWFPCLTAGVQSKALAPVNTGRKQGATLRDAKRALVFRFI
jgi:hypothetical protein